MFPACVVATWIARGRAQADTAGYTPLDKLIHPLKSPKFHSEHDKSIFDMSDRIF